MQYTREVQLLWWFSLREPSRVWGNQRPSHSILLKAIPQWPIKQQHGFHASGNPPTHTDVRTPITISVQLPRGNVRSLKFPSNEPPDDANLSNGPNTLDQHVSPLTNPYSVHPETNWPYGTRVSQKWNYETRADVIKAIYTRFAAWEFREKYEFTSYSICPKCWFSVQFEWWQGPT